MAWKAEDMQPLEMAKSNVISSKAGAQDDKAQL